MISWPDEAVRQFDDRRRRRRRRHRRRRRRRHCHDDHLAQVELKQGTLSLNSQAHHVSVVDLQKVRK